MSFICYICIFKGSTFIRVKYYQLFWSNNQKRTIKEKNNLNRIKKERIKKLSLSFGSYTFYCSLFSAYSWIFYQRINGSSNLLWCATIKYITFV